MEGGIGAISTAFSGPDLELPLRMYQYHHRIADRFGRRVVSLAVLADGRDGWCPDCYREELWGCRIRFEYPVCKLLDFGREPLRLEGSDNPAAVVIAAHLAAQASCGDVSLRAKRKWELTRRLYDRGYGKQDILKLYRLIDWLMVLPDVLEVEFRRELIQYEQEKVMPYITSIERLGRQEGRQEGRREGRQETLQEVILDVLEARFGTVPYEMRGRIQAIADEAELKRLHRQAALVESSEIFAESI